MVKKARLIITAMFMLIFSAGNIFLFLNKGKLSYNGFSGMVVKEMPELPANIGISIISFIVLWTILLIIAIRAYMYFLKSKKEEKVKLNFNQLSAKGGKSRTDLDIFYDLLKEKKKLNTGTISRVFKISKENALEWSRILENHALVNIDYPNFSDPEVKINEKETEEKTEENKSIENKNIEKINTNEKKQKKNKRKHIRKKKRKRKYNFKKIRRR